MNVIEMDGFLKGKCIPGDIRVNETTAEYLVRKFQEAEDKNKAMCAENCTLRGYIDESCFVVEGGEYVDAVVPPMESTERFVNEIMAMGVEWFAFDERKAAAQWERDGMVEFFVTARREIADAADRYADRLRKGE